MTDRPEDRPQERRRTGPLGDNDTDEETRHDTRSSDEGATRPVRAERRDEPAAGGDRTTRVSRGENSANKETRVIRAQGAQPARESSYPRGYFEAVDERAERLRDIYGGVDWLASFLGFIFAALLGALFFVVAGLVLRPLGGADLLSGGEIGAAAITGLGLVAILVFLTYFFGGYVAGRLARFDGGRNGVVSVLFTAFVILLLIPIGGFLPGPVGDSIRSFIQNSILPMIGRVAEVGIVGAVIAVCALLVALLGGFLGGRLGSRYHDEIDRTT